MESHPLFAGEYALPGVWTHTAQGPWVAASRAYLTGHNCDRFEVIQDGDQLYVAVMDGAGSNSREAVDLVAEELPRIIFARPASDAGTQEDFSRIFSALDALVERTGDSSLTLTLVLLAPGRLTVAYVGDSEAFLFCGVENRKILPLTLPHQTDHPREEERLLRAEAVVQRGRLVVEWEGGRRTTNLTRAIGGRPFGQLLSHTPDVVTRSIRPEDQFLVLATDGIAEAFGELRPFQQGVAALPPSTTADGILRYVFADLEGRNLFSDDATAVVIDLTSFRARTG